MVNQQKGGQQDTAYSAVVVNDHVYPCPYIIFYPKWVIETCIGRGGDTYDHSLQLHYRQYLLFADLPSLPPSFTEMIFILVPLILFSCLS